MSALAFDDSTPSVYTPPTSGLMAQTPHITVPVDKYDRMAAVVEAARAISRLYDVPARRHWLRLLPPHTKALVAAVDALDAPEATS